MKLRNLGMDLVGATEEAAVSAGRWMGFGHREEPDQSAIEAMHSVLSDLDINGYIIVGEEKDEARHHGKDVSADEPYIQSGLDSGQSVGTGQGPELDIVLDAIDGRNLLALGHSDAISVVGAAPRGSMWVPPPEALYMDKIVVNREAAEALVSECMDAPAAWTLALVARVKKKEVRDLIVFVLNRPRHRDLVEEIRDAGARVLLRSDGDIAGALMASFPESDVDLLMGAGGVAEGLIAACAVKALGGAMLGRLAPQSDQERTAITEAGLDTKQILTCDDLIDSDQIFFTATGITDGMLLSGVHYRGEIAQTESMVLRTEGDTHRIIQAKHMLKENGR